MSGMCPKSEDGKHKFEGSHCGLCGYTAPAISRTEQEAPVSEMSSVSHEVAAQEFVLVLNVKCECVAGEPADTEAIAESMCQYIEDKALSEFTTDYEGHYVVTMFTAEPGPTSQPAPQNGLSENPPVTASIPENVSSPSLSEQVNAFVDFWNGPECDFAGMYSSRECERHRKTWKAAVTWALSRTTEASSSQEQDMRGCSTAGSEAETGDGL